MRVGRAAVLAQHDDAIAVGEVGESLGQRDELEHRRRTLQLVAARRSHRADHGDLGAVHLANDHGDFRGRHVLRQPLRQLLAQSGSASSPAA